MTIKETVDRFNSLYELNKLPVEQKENYCCGAVMDVQEHSNMYIAVTKCDSKATVQSLLDELSKNGFTIIPLENDDTLYVYMRRCNAMV